MFLSKHFTSLCVLLLNLSGYILEFFENIQEKLKSNSYINYIICKTYCYYDVCYSYLNNLLIEPDDDFLRSSLLNDNNDLELYYHNIEDIKNEKNKVANLIHKKNDYLVTYKFSVNDEKYISCVITNPKTINSLFVNIHNTNVFDLKQYLHNFIKVYQNTVVRSVSKNDIKPFLAIMYTHPEQSDKLSISLDKIYYAPHNDILDSIFIKTFLSKTYNRNKYIFDDNYEVTLIDHNANFHTLNYKQYIHFEYKDWHILEKKT